jgi:hypothetical protein
MLTSRTGAPISQNQPSCGPSSRAQLEPVAKGSRGFGEGLALPREEFLYDFKRRLRAARKRAVLAAEYRGARVARIPTSPQHGPAVPTWAALSSRTVGKGRRAGSCCGQSAGIGLALHAPRLGPCTQMRTGRSSLAGRDAHGPSPVEGRKKSVRPAGTVHQFRGTYFLFDPRQAPFRERSVYLSPL